MTSPATLKTADSLSAFGRFTDSAQHIVLPPVLRLCDEEWLAALSAEERERLAAFKTAIAATNVAQCALRLSDRFLMRILFTRKLDIERALDLLRKHLAWREKYAIDDSPFGGVDPLREFPALATSGTQMFIPGTSARGGAGVAYLIPRLMPTEKQTVRSVRPADAEAQRREQDIANLLALARTADLSEIARLNVLYHSGQDAHGRAIIVLVGPHIPTAPPLLDSLLLYLFRILDTASSGREFVVLYAHCSDDSHQPPFQWLRRAYSLWEHRYASKLAAVYVLHPTFMFKCFLGLLAPFMAKGMWGRLHFCNNLHELTMTTPNLNVTALNLPKSVAEADRARAPSTKRQPPRPATTPPPAVPTTVPATAAAAAASASASASPAPVQPSSISTYDSL